MSKKEKWHPMEYVWIVAFVLTFLMFLLRTINYGFRDGGSTMLIFSAMSLVMYLWRRQLRKNENNNN